MYHANHSIPRRFVGGKILAFLTLSIWLIQGCSSPQPDAPLRPKEDKGDSAALWSAIQNDPLQAQLSFMEIKVTPFVFNTTTFPTADFTSPDIVRKALGDYKITTTFYNSDYQQATTPDKPGRYGAVVNVRFASGISMDRYYTVYHYTGDFSEHLDWWRWAAHDKEPVVLHMPAILGIDRSAEQRYAGDIATYVRFGFFEDLLKRPYAARLLAGLQESKPADDPKDVKNDIIVRDREWWLGLKRKLHPVDSSGFRNVSGPEILSSPAFTPLSVKSPSAARMSDKVTKEVDDILGKWAKESGEPFSVVLARNGVVYYQKAFGQYDGAPLTLNTPLHIASINKTYTAILLMMCVERKLISLDDDISKFFPDLKDAKWSKPITVRHLATHTSGLPDLTLDELNDLEEVIKPILPYVHPGEKYSYSETNYSLLGKIMEVVSGKSIAVLMNEWLVKPLKMNTVVHGAASDAYSTPMDLAKVGQLLLNKGTYDNVRYFNEATFHVMLPAAGGIGAGQGIGMMSEGGEVSSKKMPAERLQEVIDPAVVAVKNKELGFGQLYGHLASSGTTFAVDPTSNLVIVMTRNNAGKDFVQNNVQFMKSISSNVIK